MDKGLPIQHNFTLAFKDNVIEREFLQAYDESIKLPLRYGIIISILSWFSGITLIYFVIPDKLVWLSLLMVVYIGSFFGFIVYTTYKKRFKGYYHLIGALSNAWAGLFAVYFCDQFPDGAVFILPVLIFIIFFGSYMVRLRWMAGCVAAISYISLYHIYLVAYSDLPAGQVILYAFVGWITMVFTVLAGRVTENNNRTAYIQNKTITEQNAIIEDEKVMLLKEVHHSLL